MWEKNININDVSEIRTRSTVYLGAGAISKIDSIAAELKARGINRIIVMTGRGAYKKTGAWDFVVKALDANNIAYKLYDKVTPNPTVDHVDEATKIAKDFGAKAVLAIGGGSPIDAGKSVAILISNPEKTARDLYELKFVPTEAVPVICVNLTHGTGTEADRFAVVSIPEKEYKPAIAYDCIYPLYSIDDPALMTKLSPAQTLYVSVDAVNHVVEAATSKVASPFTILLAQETIRLVAKYLPKAIADPEDITARYYLLYASLIAGVSFDNGLLHFTHALEHPLSAVKPELSHGLGLAMILPSVVKAIYPASGKVLASIFEPIAPELTGSADEAETAAEAVENWLFSIGVKSKLEDEGFNAADIDKLVNLAKTTPSLDGLLSIAPVEATAEVIADIYKTSLKPLTRSLAAA